MKIWVAGAGWRGSHGCSESFVVEGTVVPAHDGVHDYVVYGKIVKHDLCSFCSNESLVGKEVNWGVWYNPEYYGHDGYQL